MVKILSNHVRTILTVALIAGGLSGASLSVAASPASATTAVTLYVTPGGGGTSCSQSAPCGAIQNAVNAATQNDAGDDVTIDVAAGSYTENDSINASSLDSLAIAGAGAPTTTVSGGAVGSVLTVSSGTVTVSDLDLEKGDAATGGGGGINNHAVLTVIDSFVSGDTSSSSGGGIENHAGATLTVSESTLSGDTAAVGGGGIDNAGGLTVADTYLENNSTSQNTDAPGYGGAGIASSGTATIDDSTLSGNTTASIGGAIRNDGSVLVTDGTVTTNSSPVAGGGIWNDGSLTLYNSTVDGNSTSDSGGGVENTGSITVTDSTVSNNTATQDGGGIQNDNGSMNLKNSTVYGNTATDGGAINNAGGSGDVVLAESTVSNNSGPAIENMEGTVSTIDSIIATNDAGPDCHGSLADLGYNLTDDTSCGLAASTDVHANPDLGLLDMNGGATATAVPSLGSQAMGAIPTGTSTNQVQLCPRVDQSGVSSVGRCTIGAAEGGFLITTTSLPDATSGAAYGPVYLDDRSAGLSTRPYETTVEWGAAGLPRWLTLTSRGILTGSPHQKTGRYSFTVIANETVESLDGTKVVKTETTVSAGMSLKVRPLSPLAFVPRISQFPTLTIGESPYPPVAGRPSYCTASLEMSDFAQVVGGVAPYTATFSTSPEVLFSLDQYGIGAFFRDPPDQLEFATEIGSSLFVGGTPGGEAVENSVITFTATDAMGASTSVSFPWTLDNPDGITGCIP